MHVEVQWIKLTVEREKFGRRYTAIFRWKKNESTWSTEIEVDGLGDGCDLKITYEEDVGRGSRIIVCKCKA
jgi:hypothetical protein